MMKVCNQRVINEASSVVVCRYSHGVPLDWCAEDQQDDPNKRLDAGLFICMITIIIIHLFSDSNSEILKKYCNFYIYKYIYYCVCIHLKVMKMFLRTSGDTVSLFNSNSKCMTTINLNIFKNG
jgi:hypothetical protein